jgi:LuxR family transcriptional regulator, maltose regulon positive regulatory protein
MIERAGLSIAYQGQVHMVLGWLNALPDMVVAARPFLCILSADLLMYTQQTEAAENRLQLAERAVLAELPLEQQEIIQGLVAVIRAQIARYTGDLPACVGFARDALRLLPETRMWARAAAMLNVAHDYLMSGAVPSATEQLIAEVVAGARAAGDLVLQLRSITLLARLQVLQGRLQQAAITYGNVLRIVATPDMLGFLPGGAAYCFGLGEILREWNDLDGAENQLKQGVETLGGSLLVAAEDVTLGYLSLARVQHARGDDDGARASLAAFSDVATQRHFPPYLQARGVALQIQFELARGNLTPARRWLASSGPSADDILSFPREQEYLLLARVHIALAYVNPLSPLLQDALSLLDRLLADAEAKTRVRSALEILVVQALVFAAQAHWTAALASLEQALVRAEPEGYVRLFLDEGTAMVALLRDAYAHDVTPAYVTALLAACGERIDTVPAPQAGDLLEPLTERERDVLRLLVAGLSNAAIARELVVTVGTVKSHVNHLYGKLGVTSRTQAIARAHALHIG